MSAAIQLAKPFLPKQFTNIFDAQNQLKALEVELLYAKTNFERFRNIVNSMRDFSDVYEFKMCAINEAVFFLEEWDKQLLKFENDAQKSVFNTLLDTSIRTVNADKFRKRLANFQAIMQTVQANVILESQALQMQLGTASLLPNPEVVIQAIRENYTKPCPKTEFTKEQGLLAQIPKDWLQAGQKVRESLGYGSPSASASAKLDEVIQPPTMQKTFLTPDYQRQLNQVIA